MSNLIENLRPLNDRVLIKRLEPEEKSAGGIIIPDVAKEKVQMGKVMAIGRGTLLSTGEVQPLQLKVGDTVFFGKYSGTEADTDYVILKEEDILGVVENNK